MSNETGPRAVPQAAHGHSSVRTYLVIFVTLALLTLLTVGVAYMKLPHAAGVVIALIIAAVKVFLIASFFMHLRMEGHLINVSLGVCLALVLILVVFVLPDLGIHEIEEAQRQEAMHQSESLYGAAHEASEHPGEAAPGGH